MPRISRKDFAKFYFGDTYVIMSILVVVLLNSLSGNRYSQFLIDIDHPSLYICFEPANDSLQLNGSNCIDRASITGIRIFDVTAMTGKRGLR